MGLHHSKASDPNAPGSNSRAVKSLRLPCFVYTDHQHVAVEFIEHPGGRAPQGVSGSSVGPTTTQATGVPASAVTTDPIATRSAHIVRP
jgi:hypothetical protein